MGSYGGICEIVEAKEEHSGGCYPSKSELSVDEIDINQLFEAISVKNLSKGLGMSPQPGASPLRKNALKKPITVGMPRSPAYGNSESVSLKQALRELCITKASEMAAIKRLSNFTGSSGNSEAGRIKSLYNSVVVDTSGTALYLDKGKKGVADISPDPGTNISYSSVKIPHGLQALKSKSSNQSARSSATTTENATGIVRIRDEIVSSSVHLQLPKIKTSITHSPQYAVETTENGTGMTPMHKDMVSTSVHLSKPVREISNQRVSSPQHVVATTKNVMGMSLMQNEIVSAPKKVGTGTLKKEQTQKENHTSVSSHTVENTSEPHKRSPVSIKLSNKASVPKLGRKGRLQKLPSSSISANDNGVSKVARNAQRLAKPALRTKNFVKKKKQDSTYSEVNSELGPSTSELVCQRCQCSLKDATKETNKDSSASQLTNVSAAVSPINKSTGVSKPGFTLNGCNENKPIVVKVKKNSKLREKGEISQSSKSSMGEHSSNTSISDDSFVSGSSCGNRPHMSKDARWEAIRHIRVQHGFLGLSHFNLLKKLGCGDIGTVYLAELIGTNCLFAIKVMDNDFLARRKKMPRAQTEREILRMLDHPFLPTLYAQFTSDNLSCLVMEYCPGGDLHVLRQKQSGRSFPEQAARFYVAEVLLALEYLHMLGVVYRDLKPENILVREDGHIMLTDFDLSLRCTVNPTLITSSPRPMDPVRLSGPCTESSCIAPFCIEPSCQVPCFSPRLPASAKTRKTKAELAAQIRSLPLLVAEPTDARSNSFVGTHEYLAPEIIKGEGHGAAVDWWTFGIFLYELLYGKTPFKGAGNEETLANVVLQTLKFPDCPLISFQARDLIQVLLVKDPENRLGTEKGAAEIKQHPFFEGLNWALIRCAIPPELPEFYDFGISTTASQDKKSKYLECKTTGEHLEFELF